MAFPTKPAIAGTISYVGLMYTRAQQSSVKMYL